MSEQFNEVKTVLDATVNKVDAIVDAVVADDSVTPSETYLPNTQITELLFEGLSDLMDDYEIWDIIDIVDALKLGDNKVWVNMKVTTVKALLDATQNKLASAKSIVPIAWLGGPPRIEDGKIKKKLMRGSLMHYVIDVILRETIEKETNKSLVQVAACRLSMEG